MFESPEKARARLIAKQVGDLCALLPTQQSRLEAVIVHEWDMMPLPPRTRANPLQRRPKPAGPLDALEAAVARATRALVNGQAAHATAVADKEAGEALAAAPPKGGPPPPDSAKLMALGERVRRSHEAVGECQSLLGDATNELERARAEEVVRVELRAKVALEAKLIGIHFNVTGRVLPNRYAQQLHQRSLVAGATPLDPPEYAQIELSYRDLHEALAGALGLQVELTTVGSLVERLARGARSRPTSVTGRERLPPATTISFAAIRAAFVPGLAAATAAASGGSGSSDKATYRAVPSLRFGGGDLSFADVARPSSAAPAGASRAGAAAAARPASASP
jgi:hypothetical protein